MWRSVRCFSITLKTYRTRARARARIFSATLRVTRGAHRMKIMAAAPTAARRRDGKKRSVTQRSQRVLLKIYSVQFREKYRLVPRCSVCVAPRLCLLSPPPSSHCVFFSPSTLLLFVPGGSPYLLFPAFMRPCIRALASCRGGACATANSAIHFSTLRYHPACRSIISRLCASRDITINYRRARVNPFSSSEMLSTKTRFTIKFTPTK